LKVKASIEKVAKKIRKILKYKCPDSSDDSDHRIAHAHKKLKKKKQKLAHLKRDFAQLACGKVPLTEGERAERIA